MFLAPTRSTHILFLGQKISYEIEDTGALYVHL